MYNKNVKYKSNLIYTQGTPSMTIIAGVKFDLGVAIASDSQATMGDTLKRIDKRKITEIEEFQNIRFNFAGAGDARLIEIAKEQLILECRNREINAVLDFKNACEDVVKFIKRRYVENDECPNLEFLTGVATKQDFGLLKVFPDGGSFM